jgi:hypothetical protein
VLVMNRIIDCHTPPLVNSRASGSLILANIVDLLSFSLHLLQPLFLLTLRFALVRFPFVTLVCGVLVGLDWVLVYPGTFWAGCSLSKHLSKR